ncbi:MAG: acyl-ACP--UDP-N-acetylglucosamine O-acyltransferase [Chloroherpetonaceae bacterium]|nr:acyl-ACP--UDP-N-acetylglucosamine O-acyltransferase [Chloroherpetonaceae bacterium]
MDNLKTQIHPTAIVGHNVQLGKGVRIGPYAILEDDVTIGEGTEIYPHALIYNGARIGKNCKIFPGAVIAIRPQDLKYAEERTFVEIGDYTTIREYATVHRATGENGVTKIGGHCLIMAYVHVAHDVRIGNHVIISNTTQIAGHCEIEDHATIGGVCGIHQFTRIGKHTMLASSSRVVYDVPPYVMAGREPFRYEGLNLVGLKRRGFSAEAIRTIRDIYRLVFQSGFLIKNAIEKIEHEFPQSDEREEILGFLHKLGKRKLLRSPHRAGGSE